MHVHSSRPVVHGQRGAVLDALRHFPLDPHPSKYWSERRVTFSARLFVSVHVRVVRRLVRGNLLLRGVPVRRRRRRRPFFLFLRGGGSPGGGTGGDDDRGMNHRTIHFRDGRIQFCRSRRRSRRRWTTRVLLLLLLLVVVVVLVGDGKEQPVGRGGRQEEGRRQLGSGGGWAGLPESGPEDNRGRGVRDTNMAPLRAVVRPHGAAQRFVPA